MPKHEFGIMENPPQINERYDVFEPEKYACISVDDGLIAPLLDKLSLIECYWHTLERPGKNLAYYGITLIPPSSMEQFIEILEGVAGTEELRSLLFRAIEEDKYVIHFGI